MQAIVLERRDFREFDQIISLYTKEHGRLDLLARGVKKITSKNAAHVEPFSYVFIEVAGGKEIDHLTKVVPIHFFAGIRQSLEKSLAAGFAVSFLKNILHGSQPDGRLWQLLEQWLMALEKAGIFDPLSVDACVLQIFACLGFRPVLDRCVISGISFHDMVQAELAGAKKEKPGFYFVGGGLVAAAVRQEKEQVDEEVVLCGLRDISNMERLLRQEWREAKPIEISTEERSALHRLILAYARYHSERPVVDWNGLGLIV